MRLTVFPFFLPYKCKGKSKTVPNQAYEVADILRKFAAGIQNDLLNEDDLGEDYDEDIDTPIDPTRDPSYDLLQAHDDLTEFNRQMSELARHDLDNDVLDDTTKKNNEKLQENLPN